VLSILVDSQLIVEQMSEVIRDIMANLRPPVIEDYGLVAAIRWYADRFASRTGIDVTVKGEEPSPRLSHPHESALYRIAQEVFTNIAKHAQATRVSVNVAAEGEKVRLVITDDGIGFDIKEVDMSNGQAGWGLVIMSERVRSMGGSFNIESRPGHGTRVTVEVVL
jgi:signal transduction histidine kinase